jgi:hypothetical protein
MSVQIRQQFEAFFLETMAPAIRKASMDEYAKRPPQWSQVVDDLTSKRSIEQFLELAGFGLAREVPEGANVSYDEMRQGPVKTFAHKDYGLGFKVTHQVMRDQGKWNLVKRMSGMLGRSISETQELQIAGIFNNAFDTAYIQYLGKPLCSTSHPLLRGGTWSNRLSAVTLSMGSLEQALLVMERTPSVTGFPARLVAEKLIVPRRNRFAAYELTKSPNNPETANNTGVNRLSAAEGGIPKPFVYQYLTDDPTNKGPVEFMLLADQNPVVAYTREAAYTDEFFDKENRIGKNVMFYAWSYGAQGQRGIVGVPTVGSGF